MSDITFFARLFAMNESSDSWPISKGTVRSMTANPGSPSFRVKAVLVWVPSARATLGIKEAQEQHQ